MIVIRVDANENIGTGHVMRCLSIASWIQDLNDDVFFVVADERSMRMIEEQGYQTVCLHSKWDDLDQEIEIMFKLIEEFSVSKILIDSYFVTEKYLNALRKRTAIFYIDDLNRILYSVDILINYNIYGPGSNYSRIDKKLLLGTRYAPLRRQFTGIEKRTFNGIRRIMITSGGTDNYDMIGRILSKLLSNKAYQDKRYYCVLGRFNKNVDKINKKFSGWKNVYLCQNIKNIDFYMKECDIAITAGGSTIYELCACGIPSIMYTFADNQLGNASAFSSKGIIPWVGDVREEIDVCLDKILYEIRRLEDPDRWEQQSRTMQSIVDGNGALRIAREIVDYDVRHRSL